MLITTSDSEFHLTKEDYNYNYQKELTKKLDTNNSDFTQEIINEIVLWKINRYAKLDDETIESLENIDKNSNHLNDEITTRILYKLLKTKGIQIAVASTILKFKNPHIYQIIDQRVFRIIYGIKLEKFNSNKSDISITKQISIYLKYLKDLRNVCDRLKIKFDQADRVLYQADKRLNKKEKLDNY